MEQLAVQVLDSQELVHSHFDLLFVTRVELDCL